MLLAVVTPHAVSNAGGNCGICVTVVRVHHCAVERFANERFADKVRRELVRADKLLDSPDVLRQIVIDKRSAIPSQLSTKPKASGKNGRAPASPPTFALSRVLLPRPRG